MPFPSPGDLPDPGIEPRSPALQADSSLLHHSVRPRRVLLDSTVYDVVLSPVVSALPTPLVFFPNTVENYSGYELHKRFPQLPCPQGTGHLEQRLFLSVVPGPVALASPGTSQM